jgi:hypothetical protein
MHQSHSCAVVSELRDLCAFHPKWRLGVGNSVIPARLPPLSRAKIYEDVFKVVLLSIYNILSYRYLLPFYTLIFSCLSRHYS